MVSWTKQDLPGHMVAKHTVYCTLANQMLLGICIIKKERWTTSHFCFPQQLVSGDVQPHLAITLGCQLIASAAEVPSWDTI